MRAINASPVWDAHSCLPIKAGVTFENLDRHRAAGFDFVSVNVAMDMTPLADTLTALAWFRSRIAARPDKYVLAVCAQDVEAARASGRLAVAFDIEGATCLLGRPEMVALYARLGVRQMHLAYNLDNAYAGGCHGANQGLTTLGAEVVRAANAAGVVMDCSHTSVRASFEIMALSSKPVVFSHSNARALADQKRNITDAQIRACAETGGVVGVCAYSRFLGAFPSRVEDMARHIDHIAQLVGADHVGLGWDHDYPSEGVALAGDEAEFRRYFVDAAATQDARPDEADACVPLEACARLPDLLRARGYAPADVDKIMGLNFLRVAQACWPDTESPSPRNSAHDAGA